MATPLHAARLEAVLHILLQSGAERVLDLGCGRGELLELLVAEPQFKKILGMDISAEALSAARHLLAGQGEGRLNLIQGSYTVVDEQCLGFDAALLVETIEHLDPSLLSRLERVVFASYHPRLVIITTPNREYNRVHGLPEGARRHPGHYFEWSRAKFRAWSEGVACRNGYGVAFGDLGESDPLLGSSTQMAVFTRSQS